MASFSLAVVLSDLETKQSQHPYAVRLPVN